MQEIVKNTADICYSASTRAKRIHYCSFSIVALNLHKLNLDRGIRTDDYCLQWRRTSCAAALTETKAIVCISAVKCVGPQVSGLPAHLIEEAVRFGHPVELVFVFLQQIHVTLLWNELQQLEEGGIKCHSYIKEVRIQMVSAAGRGQQLPFAALHSVPAPACL